MHERVRWRRIVRHSSTVSRHTHRAIFATTTTSIMATTTTTITTTMTMMTLRTISTTMHRRRRWRWARRWTMRRRCICLATSCRAQSRALASLFAGLLSYVLWLSFMYFCNKLLLFFRILGCAWSTSKHSSNNENFHSRFLLSSNSKFVCWFRSWWIANRLLRRCWAYTIDLVVIFQSVSIYYSIFLSIVFLKKTKMQLQFDHQYRR